MITEHYAPRSSFYDYARISQGLTGGSSTAAFKPGFGNRPKDPAHDDAYPKTGDPLQTTPNSWTWNQEFGIRAQDYTSTADVSDRTGSTTSTICMSLANRTSLSTEIMSHACEPKSAPISQHGPFIYSPVPGDLPPSQFWHDKLAETWKSDTFTFETEAFVAARRSQIDAVARTQRLLHYISYAHETGVISRNAAVLALKILTNALTSLQAVLPIPDACYSDAGDLLLMWENDANYLEVEIDPSGSSAFFFYKNGSTGQIWSEEQPGSANLTEETVAKLRMFA